MSGASLSDVSEYLPRVEILAKMLWLRLGWILANHMTFDDLFQIGVVGMLEARGRWKPERGASFWTFADQRVTGAMYDHVRSDPHIPISRDQRENFLKLQPFQDFDGNEDRCLNRVPQDPQDLDLLKRMKSTLTAKELRVIYLRFFEDRTRLYIAGKMGWTEVNVLLYERRALLKLRRVYDSAATPRGAAVLLVGCRKSGPRQPAKWIPRDAWNVQRMHKNGRSLSDIANKLGLSKSTVHRMLHRDTSWMPSRPGTFHRISISKAVFEEIERRGTFGESVDDVLRRIMDLPLGNINHNGVRNVARPAKRVPARSADNLHAPG